MIAPIRIFVVWSSPADGATAVPVDDAKDDVDCETIILFVDVSIEDTVIVALAVVLGVLVLGGGAVVGGRLTQHARPMPTIRQMETDEFVSNACRSGATHTSARVHVPFCGGVAMLRHD
jgi:hypothetical protein